MKNIDEFALEVTRDIWKIGNRLTGETSQKMAEIQERVCQALNEWSQPVASAEPVAWLPIESAPKDGTDVLVLLDCATVAVAHIAFYRDAEEWEHSGQYCGGWDSLEDWEGWWSYTVGSVGQEKLEGYRLPTHWMPLPAAPGEGE